MTTSQVAILFPAVLFWLMLIVQYGLWWHAAQVADAAAGHAIDAAETPTGTADAGHAAATTFLTEAGNITAVDVTVHRTPTLVTAEVRGNAPRLVPGFDWTVTAHAEGPVERFIPEANR